MKQATKHELLGWYALLALLGVTVPVLWAGGHRLFHNWLATEGGWIISKATEQAALWEHAVAEASLMLVCMVCAFLGYKALRVLAVDVGRAVCREVERWAETKGSNERQ